MANALIPFTMLGSSHLARLARRAAHACTRLGNGVAIVGIVLTWRAPNRVGCYPRIAAVLGAFRYNFVQPHFDQSSLATYNDQQKSVIVEGLVVVSQTPRDAYTNLRVEATTLLSADQPTRTVRGLFLVQAPPFTDFRYATGEAEGKTPNADRCGRLFLP